MPYKARRLNMHERGRSAGRGRGDRRAYANAGWRRGAPCDPAQIPHEVEKRRATTRTNPEPKQQVKHRIPDNVAGHRIGPDHALKVETCVEMSASRRHGATAPPAKLFCRYVTQEIRSTVGDGSVAVRPRVQCGTSAGHMSPGSEPEALEQAADLRFLSWGGQDLNLRPTDYESAALTD